jgi:hypothetical protein
VLRVPVEVRGTSDDGSPLEEATYTAVVGVQGALLLTSRLLKMGSEVSVTNRFSQQTGTFRVVWINARKTDILWEIGVESLQPLEDFWGVRFPPKLDAR